MLIIKAVPNYLERLLALDFMSIVLYNYLFRRAMAEAILFLPRGLLRFSASVGFERYPSSTSTAGILVFRRTVKLACLTPLSFTPNR